MQIAVLGGAAHFSRGPEFWECRRGPGARVEKIGVEVLHHVILTADHHAVAPIQSPTRPPLVPTST